MTNEGSFGMPLAARPRNTRAPGDLLKITSDNLVIPKLWLIRCIPEQIGEHVTCIVVMNHLENVNFIKLHIVRKQQAKV